MLTRQIFWALLAWVWDDPVCKIIILFLFLYLLTIWSDRPQRVTTGLALTSFRQSKRSSMTTTSSSIGLLTDDNVCHDSTGPGLPFTPLSFLCHVWKLMGVQIFVLLLTFFRCGWRNLTGKKKSLIWNELTWNHKTNKWLIILYDREGCQNSPLAILHPGEERQLSVWTFTLWVGEDIESHWWERRKTHLIS